MEIVLFKIINLTELPSEIINILSKDYFPKNRTGELVEYIKKHGKNLFSKGMFYSLGNNLFEIFTIDTSYPWTILEYDGDEFIEYLKYKIVDKTLNYFEFITEIKKDNIDDMNKCNMCNGTGMVQPAPNVRGIETCPLCNGKGVKK